MLGMTQRNRTDSQALDAGASSATGSREAVLASIDHSVGQLRGSNITPRQFRQLAAERRRSQERAWATIRHAARARGAR